MPRLTFSAFAKLLYPSMSGDYRVGEFCRNLFEMATDESIHKELIRESLEIWNSRFSGTRSINALAKRIFPKLQIEKFGAYINNFDDSVKRYIVSELKPYRPGIDENSVGMECADLFLDIIQSAAQNYRKRENLDVSKQIENSEIDIVKIEDDLKIVIEGLSKINSSQVSHLRLFALELPNKIKSEYGLLLSKVSWQVNLFYYQVVELFECIGSLQGKPFKLIATEISLRYQKLSAECINQEEIFNRLIDWLQQCVPNASRISYEIIISFFVQNCEVFDELS